MSDEVITNAVLLQHMQGMKNELQQQIFGLDTKFNGLNARFDGLQREMRVGFAEAKQHRDAIQEDLEASIQMLGRHQQKLAHL